MNELADEADDRDLVLIDRWVSNRPRQGCEHARGTEHGHADEITGYEVEEVPAKELYEKYSVPGGEKDHTVPHAVFNASRLARGLREGARVREAVRVGGSEQFCP